MALATATARAAHLPAPRPFSSSPPPAPTRRSTARSIHKPDRGDGGPSGGRTAAAALTLAALGVVFGDIGTSPLYTISTVFNPDDPHPVTQSMVSVFGVISAKIRTNIESTNEIA